MFFVLSKVLFHLVNPLLWISALLVYACFTGRPRRRKRLLLIATVLLLFFGNAFIVDEFFRAWEKSPAQDRPGARYTWAIVPGGLGNTLEHQGRMQFHHGSDRLWQALRFQREGIVKNILISSGAGRLDEPEDVEAVGVRNYLEKAGLMNARIYFESLSKNTYENARNCWQYMPDEARRDSVLLITSGYHVRRARACFEKQGFVCAVYGVDLYAGPRKYAPDHLLLPRWQSFRLWELLFHEWLGYGVYALMGYL